jgi:Tol biopolymer transport system component
MAAGAVPAEREPDFSGWSQVRTEHFIFVYEPRDKEAVRELLSFAEEAYAEVTLFLETTPREIWVVVRGRVDAANGYTTSSPPHIVLYLAPPSEPLIGLDASSYLRLLFVHELTHYVNFQYDRGALSLGENLFGPGIKNVEAVFYGYAMMEGIATETETLFTDGGRGRNPFFELEPRALALEHSFFSLRHVSFGSSFPPYDRVWLGGYLFVHYLLQQYGPDVIRKVHAAYAASPLLGPWAAVRRVTGHDASEVFAGMIRDLEARYSATATLTPGRQVSPSGIGDYFLPVAAEPGWYLYRSTQEKPGAIVRWDPQTGKERILLTTGLSDASSLTASKDGSQIVFATTDQTVGKSGTLLLSDLFTLDPITGTVRRITTGAHLWQPRFSPDGSTLIAVQAEGDHTRLVRVDRASGKVTVLYARAGATVCTPAFSPDGARIALGVQAGGRNDIVLLALPLPEAAPGPDGQPINVNVASATPLLSDAPGREYYPSFIDNTTVAFSSDRGSALALYSAAVDGHDPTLLCDDPVGAWAGESIGGKIVYGTWRSSGFTLMQKDPVVQPSPSVQARQPAESTPLPAMPPSTRYVDFPRFLFWAPMPLYLTNVAASDLVLAPSVLFGSLSNLESSSFDAAFSFRTDWLQPGAQVDFESVLGTAQVSYALSEGFATSGSGDSQEELQQQLLFSFPLASDIVLGTMTGLTATTGVVDALLLSSAEPFGFLDGFRGIGPNGTALDFQHDIALVAGLAYTRLEGGSASDLFARNALVLSLSSSLYPPGLSGTGMGALAQGLFSLALPSPLPHQVIKVGLKTSYTTFSNSFIQVTNPRGDFDPVIQSLPGRTLVALDYQFPIALLDAPLFYVFGLTAIGAGAHVEAAADWSPGPGSLVFDRYIYTGLEVLFVISAGEGVFPLLLGTSVRIDSQLSAPFNWATDIRPYVAFSTDSFSGVGLRRGADLVPLYIRAP